MDVEIIRAIPLSQWDQEDFWAWHFEKSRVFSVRSCYRAIMSMKRSGEDWLDERSASSRIEVEQKSWSKLWKVAVPSKIKIFLWRLAKHSLPTGDIRQRRNMTPTAACSICGQEDSWRHSLIECNMARCVWALTDDDIVEHISSSTEPSVRNWLFAMMETMKTEDLTRMLVTLWVIWHAKKKAIHEEIY
jgi:hypothetical protein